MKKRIKFLLCSFIFSIILLGVCGCGNKETKEEEQIPEKTYSIMYTDASGNVNNKEVKYGSTYTIDVNNMEKVGYEFLGMYDAEVGGTKYTNSKGMSLSTYNDNYDLVLYPQYNIKKYTINLDYGEFDGDIKSLEIEYGDVLLELPLNLTIDKYEFKGWYTKENCSGKQIASSSQIINKNAIFNTTNFDISNDTSSVTLYAGYSLRKYKVTCIFNENTEAEILEVPYGTNVSDIRTSTKIEGKEVVSWSLTDKGENYNDIITSDINSS